jgi:glycosyltransferase involved in cell wall biosynthesis
VETLLKAYAMTTDRLATPPLVLAGAIPKSGGGPVCDVRGCLSRIGLDGERVRMPGRVAAEDLPALYAGAEFLVYPSRGEGFGLPPAEALAVGTPALVADVSSLPEVVTDAAWRFEPGNAEALSRRMSEAAAGWLPAPAPLPGAFHEAEAIRHYHQLIGRVSEARER